VKRQCPFVAVATTAVLLGGPASLAAQASGSVDVGGSWVDYEGYLGSGAMFVSPTLRFDTPNTSLGASGNYVVFESGRHIMQGLAAGAWRVDIAQRFRGEVSGSAGLNVYDDNPGYGHVLGRARLHFTGKLSGVWGGTATGQSYEGSTSTTPYEVEVGVWTVIENMALSAVATQTWNAGVEYLDVVGTMRWRDEHLEVNGSLGLRAASEGGGEGVYGELRTQIPIWRRLSAQVSGGRYPSDHVRGAISSNYVSVGFRLDAFRSPPPTTPVPVRALFRELERPGAPDQGEARLSVPTSLEDLHTIRVEAPGAREVDVTGDFTDWQPIPLRRMDGGQWEVTLRILPGVHRVNVRLNGGTWIVPRGLRVEVDDFGGSVGILVVR
jgi:hypothetical protein